MFTFTVAAKVFAAALAVAEPLSAAGLFLFEGCRILVFFFLRSGA